MTSGIPDFYSRIQSEILLNFTDLQDTPGLYDGSANKNVRVNAIEKELEFGGAYFDSGLDADKGVGGRKGRVWWATNSNILYYDDGANWVEILRAEAASRLASLVDHAHASLSGVSSDQHHAHEHHADHENGGDHEISVAGLSGLLADPQTPIALPKFSVHKNGTNQAGIESGAWTKITWTTEVYDDGSCFDLDNSKWIPGKIGKAHINIFLSYTTLLDGTAVYVAIRKNGVPFKALIRRVYVTGDYTIDLSCDVFIDNVADYFEVYTWQNSGESGTLNGDAGLTGFMGHMLV